MTQAQRTSAQLSTTTGGPRDPSPGAARQHPAKPAIKPVEVTGGALAAVTSALVASSFGFGGTLIGVAIGSVVSSVGAALYGSWLRRAGGRIAVTRTLVVRTVAGERTSPDDPTALPPELAADLATTPAVEVRAATPARPGRIRWKPVAALAALSFVLGLTTLTVAETIIGRPASGGSGGTTVGRLLDEPAQQTRSPEPTTSTAPGAATDGSSPSATTTDETTEPTTTTAPRSSGTTESTPSESVTGTPTESAGPSPSPEQSAPAGSGGAEPTPSEG